MEYKYLVIEDNPTAAESLKLLMAAYEDFRETIVTCDMKEGIKAVLAHKPDLIFLDVELPGFLGFDFLKALRSYLQELPEIIMTTAHDKYALTAVNQQVMYYLLKPIDPDELFAAINRFRIKKTKARKSIAVKSQHGYVFLGFDDIVLINSSSNYTFFFSSDLQHTVASKTMKEFEPLLSDQFLRVHKSYIVNTQYVYSLHTSRKRLRLRVPGLDADVPGASHLLKELLTVPGCLEIPIGEAFSDKVKNVVLYDKIG